MVQDLSKDPLSEVLAHRVPIPWRYSFVPLGPLPALLGLLTINHLASLPAKSLEVFKPLLASARLGWLPWPLSDAEVKVDRRWQQQVEVLALFLSLSLSLLI